MEVGGWLEVGGGATVMADIVNEGFNLFNYRAGREPYFTPHAGSLGMRHPVTISNIQIQSIPRPTLSLSHCLFPVFTAPSLPPPDFLSLSLSFSLFSLSKPFRLMVCA